MGTERDRDGGQNKEMSSSWEPINNDAGSLGWQRRGGGKGGRVTVVLMVYVDIVQWNHVILVACSWRELGEEMTIQRVQI